MAAYSMDLRTHVLRDCDAAMRAKDVPAKYFVSRAPGPRASAAARNGLARDTQADEVANAGPWITVGPAGSVDSGVT